jgi:DNA-binding LacI/PurR family transcriptional regulator
VPEDFSLIGFDDIEESSLAFPPLTTVGDIKDKLAKELVDTVLNFVENKKESKRIKKEIIPKLVIRDTVKQLN